MSGTVNLLKKMAREVTDPRQELNVVVGIDRHSAKMPTKHLCL